MDMLAPSEDRAGQCASLTHLYLQGELPKALWMLRSLLSGLISLLWLHPFYGTYFSRYK